MPKIFIYPKAGEALSVPLKKEKLSIGRIADNDIFLSDPYCSVYHAFIYPSKSGYVIQDNASKNGTFVNGKRIQTVSELQKGDEILIGSTRISFDQEQSINVEVVDIITPSPNVTTAIPVKEVLKKPDVPSTDLEKIKSEHKVFSILNEVSQALISHMPLKDLLDHIMDLICQNLPMDRGTLMLKEGNPPQLIPKVVRINNKNLKKEKIEVSQSIVNMVLERNSAVLTYDAQSDTRFKTKESVIESEIHSAMCAPLWSNKEIIGVVYSDRIYLLDRFSEQDLKLLTLLSNLAAVKIENAKLLEETIEKEKLEKELELAAQIQKNFLPKENILCEHFDIAGFNIPCYHVGGDYYDFIEIDPCRLGIIIADVSGKGVSASLLMASLRAALHSEIHPQIKLKEMVAKLNNFVHRSSAINTFISFMFCELNNESGELRYINAGHNPPLILNKKGKIRHMKSCGFCLGMFPSITYEEKKTTLNPDDIALLFTDGITECLSKEREELSEKRLINLLRAHAHLPAQKLIDKIFDEVNCFTADTEQMDDMTLVIIKRIS